VHAELGPMLVGGLSALLLQTLHPLVMQGVTDHSNYRDDPFGRLRRTADFLALTTYGSSERAAEAVRQVVRIHRRVRGVAPDGRPYRASDPELITYVHVTEVWSFLRAYQRYSGRPLLRAEKDLYVRETGVVARRLGARQVPSSVAEVRSYLGAVRDELNAGAAANEAATFLREPFGRSRLERAAHLVLIEAAVDLLPGFARKELGLVRPGPYRRLAVRPAAAALSGTLHLMLGEPPLLRAARTRAEEHRPNGRAPAPRTGQTGRSPSERAARSASRSSASSSSSPGGGSCWSATSAASPFGWTASSEPSRNTPASGSSAGSATG
jgi:uncharacterized protein (DUF2236 family)